MRVRVKQNRLYPYSTTRREERAKEVTLFSILEGSLSHFHQGTVVKCSASLCITLSLLYLITDFVLTYLGVWFLQEGNHLISSWMKLYGVGPALIIKTLICGAILLSHQVLSHSCKGDSIRRARWILVSGLLVINSVVIGGWFIGGLGLSLVVFPKPLVLFALSFGLLPFLFIRELGREVTLLSSGFVSGVALFLALHFAFSPILTAPVIDGPEVNPYRLKEELGLVRSKKQGVL